MSTCLLFKNVWPKSAVHFSKFIVPATKRFRRLRSWRGEAREPGVAELRPPSLRRNADERKRRLPRPATAATVFISAGNRERAGYLSRREKLVFRFPRLWNCRLWRLRYGRRIQCRRGIESARGRSWRSKP